MFLILSLIYSCTTSSTKNRGNLSDAMDKSRDDYEEEREVPDEDDTFWLKDDSQDEKDEKETQEETGEEAVELSGSLLLETTPLMVWVRGGKGFFGTPYFQPGLNGEILLGEKFNRWEIYLFAGFDHLTTTPSHSLSLSIEEDAYSVNAGLEGRFYFLPEQNVFSPYLLTRMGGAYLFWTFQNPLIAGNDTISSDILSGFLLGIGAGVDLYHGENFKLGMNIIPEACFYGEETSRGFTNDYFDAQGIIRWALEAGYNF